MTEISDREILNIFHGGSKNEGFRILVEKYKERLYWHIRKMVISHQDADDVLQEVFIKVWKKLDDFRHEATLYTWLYRIATNETLNFLKKQQKKFFIPMVDSYKMLSKKLESDAYFSGNAVDKKLQQALLKLPEKQRLVFNMKYFEDMKYEDMAEILGNSVGSLKASYHHAVKKVKAELSAIVED